MALLDATVRWVDDHHLSWITTVDREFRTLDHPNGSTKKGEAPKPGREGEAVFDWTVGRGSRGRS